MRMVRQLGREDWLLAGFQALARGGERALRIEAVARKLGVTKGSFYWHFRDRQAWRDALLCYWEHRAYADLAKGLDPAFGLAARALRADAGGPPTDPAGSGQPDWPAVEQSLRIWARQDVAVAQSLSRVLRERALPVAFSGRAA